MRVVVALSGGVDSSVAAALLKEAGHEVVGITLQQWPRGADTEAHGGCCSLSAVEDARRVASQLDLPFFVWNLEREFGERVIAPFHTAYRDGLTPNPCIRCNAFVRFGLMLGRALELGFDALATGHYARIVRGRSGPELHTGVDPAKDQSYVLYHLDQGRLERLLFPLGGLTKPQVRARARELGLPVADKAESQEICFIPRGRTSEYLRTHLAPRPGPVEDEAGRQLGTHGGTGLYTVGQRSGLGSLAEPGPWFVLRVDASANRVVVGRRQRLETTAIELEDVSYVNDQPSLPLRCEARLRYHAQPVPAVFDGVRLDLLHPFAGAAPGQSAVLYDGTRVLGGGLIRKAA